jgi:hypothetical protein
LAIPGIYVLAATLITFILGVIADKKFWSNSMNALNEFSDVVVKVRAAVEDETVTEEELREIMKEVNELIDAIKEACD